jgi:hypothetical protein
MPRSILKPAFSASSRRGDAYAHNYKVSFYHLAVFKMHDLVDSLRLGLQVKEHPVLFM